MKKRIIFNPTGAVRNGPGNVSNIRKENWRDYLRTRTISTKSALNARVIFNRAFERGIRNDAQIADIICKEANIPYAKALLLAQKFINGETMKEMARQKEEIRKKVAEAEKRRREGK